MYTMKRTRISKQINQENNNMKQSKEQGSQIKLIKRVKVSVNKEWNNLILKQTIKRTTLSNSKGNKNPKPNGQHPLIQIQTTRVKTKKCRLTNVVSV